MVDDTVVRQRNASASCGGVAADHVNHAITIEEGRHLGFLFKRKNAWQYRFSAGGRARQVSLGVCTKHEAQRRSTAIEIQVAEQRFNLLASKPPFWRDWAAACLAAIPHANTKRRATSSVNNLKRHFDGTRLSDITVSQILDFRQARLADGAGPATVNRDCAIGRRFLNLAMRMRYIPRNPFTEVEFLDERTTRQKPRIMTFEEEDRILRVAPAHVRALLTLLVETGLRANKEGLALRWEDVDFVNDCIQIRHSKTEAGERTVLMGGRCKAELMRWRDTVGPEFSPWVFPNMRDPTKPLKDIRVSWMKALSDAGVEYRPIYHLRHTYTTRAIAAGISPVFVAQLIGHKTTSILNVYARCSIDSYRRDAVQKLEALRAAATAGVEPAESLPASRVN